MTDRKSKASFVEAFIREVEGCHKGIVWNEYCFRCLVDDRIPDRVWFDKHWKRIKEKLSDPSATVDGEKEES